MTDLNPTRTSPVAPARIFRLGDSAEEDLSDSTTADERIAMVAVLSARMWELTGRPVPVYGRSEMPIQVVRLK